MGVADVEWHVQADVAEEMRKAAASLLSKLTLPEAREVDALPVQCLAYMMSGVRSVSLAGATVERVS